MKVLITAIIILVLVFSASAVLAQTFTPPDTGKKVGDTDTFAVPNPNLGKGPAGQKSLGGLVTQVINVMLLAIGSLAVVFLMFGGFRYVTSFGNEQATENSKQIIKFAVIGLLIVFMSFLIVRVISNVLLSGTGGVGI